MKYYVHIRADEVAADLWAQHAPAADSDKDGLGTILGTTEPGTVQNEKKGPEQSCSKPLSSNDF